MRHAICYVSNSLINLEQIILLFDFCHEANSLVGIKGVLLYSEGNFFQILEGEKEVVLDLFEKIKKDTRHDGIIQVMGQDIERGSFDGYKVDIIGKRLKYESKLPMEYLTALKGISPKVKKQMEKMLAVFIAAS